MDLLQNSPLKPQWNKIGIHSHKGINLPLSALHSKNSCGIGEFFDLIPLIDWCSTLNINVLQLLPLNDSGLDPSPYNALSSCAIHPIYLSLYRLPNIESHQDLLQKIISLKKLNKLSHVSFQKVLSEKTKILLSYFQKEESNIVSSSEFSDFIKKNEWIKSYALFKVLKEKNNQTHFCFWPDDQQNISKEKFEELFETFFSECSFHIITQYLCFLQLTTVKKAAEEKNVLIKGDIPILISPDSADVWFEPHLFDLQISIGAPPDYYNEEGQYWGFPLPKWDIMRENDFLWWKNRLYYASHFYDLYRIDHAIGLFRLWAIHTGRPSREGFYTPSEENLWEPLGRELLETFIKSASMLPIAEDLGDVPSMVRSVLKEMGICGTKVMRWESEDPKSYSPLSLTCVSTHDSTTLEQWWREEAHEAKCYAHKQGWSYSPSLSKEQRKSILKSSLNSGSLFHINLFSEYLALFPELVSKNPNKERINIPGTMLPSNWAYRFRRSIEEIISHPLLKEEMKELFQ